MVTAAGGGITEVRITKLVAPIFYAAVLVSGPDGPKEVDARPSDAVNLALVASAPIKIDASLFAIELPASDEGEVLADAASTADIAAEAKQKMREAMKEMGPSEGSPEP